MPEPTPPADAPEISVVVTLYDEAGSLAELPPRAGGTREARGR